jgi:hypothetical protein
MAYDHYRDSNGVTWTIVSTAHGWTMLGTVLDDADPRYDPDPGDLRNTMELTPINQVADHFVTPTAEQTRVLFLGLVDKIEAFAKEHRGATSLKVTAHADQWTPLVVLGLLLAAATSKSRRW